MKKNPRDLNDASSAGLESVDSPTHERIPERPADPATPEPDRQQSIVSTDDRHDSCDEQKPVLRGMFPIVGIVASAGGLEAFKKFFSAMPVASGMAFVLIPHLDPTHESLMVELLSRSTAMSVVEALQNMPVMINQVYIIPPANFMSIFNGQLQLSELPAQRGSQTSMDFFLRSLAQDQGEQAIGIVLSGTGSHGTLGVREIKLAGGMVFAQSPDTAEFDQMPINAIATGVVDHVLPPEEMPAALINCIKKSTLLHPPDGSLASQPSADLLEPVLTLMQARTKHDFRSYRKPMVLRRIQRRMGLTRIDSMPQYRDYLHQQPDEVAALCKDLLISVTAFFRDPEAYQILEQKLIPDMLARHSGDLPLRVWVPGCATGEEAYSIAMLLFEAVAAARKPLTIQIFASDIDADAINVARAGVYPASVVGDISAERLHRFFVIVDSHHYQINKRLREAVVFSHQNLIGDAPFSKLDLISCRNLLIYLEPEMQQRVIALFHFALGTGGYLLLGPSETIGKSTDLFETVSKKWRVYRRIGSVNREFANIPLKKIDRRNLLAQYLPLTQHRTSYKELTEHLILNDYAPAAALISRKFEVLYVTGPLANFMQFPRGEMTNNLLTMARPGLRTKLRAVCKDAWREGRTLAKLDAQVNRNGQYIKCSITARPLTELQDFDGAMLVMFQDRVAVPLLPAPTDADKENQQSGLLQTEDHLVTMQLEFELKTISEELYCTIEEMESSNEELKTSNEEIMSVNEELQSVNEELESSKEELQSLNEELNTVNSQLQDNVMELKKATEDLMNLMSSTEIATIFLDEKLNINRFTPPTKSLLNLLTTDVGRPLRDIAPKFPDDTMLNDCQQVLINRRPIDREVETEEARFFLRRVLPYRSTDQAIGGVVITFVDLTERKQSELLQRETDARHFAELNQVSERMLAIMNTAVDAIVTIDLQGRIDSLNLATETLFAFSRDELIGQNIALLMPTIFGVQPDDDTPDYVIAQIARIIGNRTEAFACRKDGSTFPVDLTLSPVDHLGLYTVIVRDISFQKQLQAHILEIANDEQRRIGQELHDGTQQELTGLSLFAGTISEALDNALSVGIAEEAVWSLTDNSYQRLKRAAARLTDGLNEAKLNVQKLSHGIMPVQIDSEGLQAALAELAKSTNEQHNIQCRFSVSGDGSVANNAIATQLYRIAQESLSNALKHGKASEILISLSKRADKVVLEVCDNGIGFDHQAIARTQSVDKGIGLRTMEYRASVLGGILQIKRNIGPGTTIRCAVPIQSELP